MVQTPPLKTTLVVLVDALRHDYVNEQDSPFLNKLAKSGYQRDIRETFAFQLRPAFFAGLYPEEADIATLYTYNPKESPFYFTRYIPRFFYTTPILRRFYRPAVRKIAQKVERARGNKASQIITHPVAIPYNLLPNFDISEKRLIFEPGSLHPHKTIFDDLREDARKWLWIAYPTDPQKAEEVLESFKNQIHTDQSLIYLHFSETDWAGHKYGPNSTERKEALKKIDKTIEDIYLTVSKKFDQINTVIFGDHGMVEVNKSVNIPRALSKTRWKLGKDYLYFLDSTQARFWFYNERAKKDILDILSALEGGHILSSDEIENLKYRFSHTKYGEVIFVAHNNYIISPNFFSGDKMVKGMHGYLPDVKDNWASVIVHSYPDPEQLKRAQQILEENNNPNLTALYDVFREMLDIKHRGT